MPDIFGSLVSYGLNRASQERSFDMQKELQRDAQAYNTLMWNRSNEYNSPASQMLRFKAAGLNPNLIYGQMNQSAAAPSIGAGSAPSSAQSSPFDSLAVLSQMASLGVAKAQEREHNANASKLETEKDAIERQLGQKDRELDIAAQNANTQKMLAESGVDVNEAQASYLNEMKNKTSEEINNLVTQGEILKIDRDFLESTSDLRKQELQATVDKIKSERNLNDKQAKFIQEQTTQLQKMYESNMLKLSAEINEINSRTDLNKQQKDNLIRRKQTEANENYWKDMAQYYRNTREAARKAGYKSYETWFYTLMEVGAGVVDIATNNALTRGLSFGK